MKQFYKEKCFGDFMIFRQDFIGGNLIQLYNFIISVA